MKTQEEIKDEIQRKGLNKWAARGYKGTLQYATGVGKTRCGVLAAAYVAKAMSMDAKILIITPTETIRDKAWVDEFFKWKEDSVLRSCVKIVCIQTAYKWSGEEFDLVIADEIHNYIPDYGETDYEYYKFFENNTFHKILGLSASIDPVKYFYLNKIAPIVDVITTLQAVMLGLVSAFSVVNVPVEFTEEEKKEYDKADKVFSVTFPFFGSLSTLYACHKKEVYDKYLRDRFTDEEEREKRRSWPYLCAEAIANRKRLIYEASEKVRVTKLISEKYPDRYGIVFSMTIPFANRISTELGEVCVPFHSKMKKSERELVLKNFSDPVTKVNRISTAKALNEGANLPRLSLAIIVAGTSKLKDTIQRIGRAIRFEEGRRSLIYRVYVKGTQEEKWLKKSQEGFTVTYVNSVEELFK